ncbi:hypothetical protein GCM10011514_29440 [Emticicia aquatilis]|uniref:Uncharacterized protein n=1 Tax=Emticicia aquatilis TaxID=1537369 RepID=A0A917DRN0_9BACT|nr:hypothetical protein [Emticicia aquatilis]GGD63521.1 hypothetical protein GCM10011514_29440 [Emticicia aquatilis]
MTQTFTSTQNDVIRYLYNETSNKENSLVEEALLFDKDLLDFYLDCADLKSGMDKIQLSPSDSAIERILSYSRNYEPKI